MIQAIKHRFNQISDSTGIGLTLIVSLAALLRFWGLGVKQLWLDEILQLLHSKPDSFKEILVGVAQDRGSAPLDYIIQHIFISGIEGDIQWVARIHAALFGIIAVLLVYLVCRELFNNNRLCLLCALLFCFYPLHHHYSQEGRPYSLFLVLVLCLYLVFLRLLKKPGWSNYALFTVIAVLSFYTHVYTVLVLFGQFLTLIYHQIRIREDHRVVFRRTIGFLCSCVLAVAAYLPWLFYSFNNAKGEVSPTINIHLFLRIIKELADGSYPLALILIICVAAGIHCLIKTGRSLQLGILLIWLLTPIPLILIILSWREYFFAVRQLIFITPVLFILTAIGINHLKQKIPHRSFYPEILIILISFVIILLHYPDKRDDFLSTSHFLENTVRHGDIIISPNTTNILAFYFPDIHRYSPGRDTTRNLLSDRDVSRIIYVETRFDQNHDAWKAQFRNMSKVNQKKYRGIIIYIFEKKLITG